MKKLFVISWGVTSIITWGGHIKFSDPEAAQHRVKLYQKEYFLKHHCDCCLHPLKTHLSCSLIGIQAHEKREASK